MRMNLSNPESRKRGRQAAEASRQAMAKELARVGVPPGLYVEWHIPVEERVGVREFEQMLIAKFGPEYLQPVRFHWADGAFCPLKAVGA